MSKEYSYNGKKYIWITDNLDGTKGCHACHFIDDADGCYVMEACTSVPYSYFVEVNTETKERIKEAMDTTYEYEGKHYKLLADKIDESTCKNCILEGSKICDNGEGNGAVNDCGRYGYFVLDKQQEEPNEETQEVIKEARGFVKEKKMLHTLGGKEYKLVQALHSEDPCDKCAFKNDDFLCDEAGNHCVNITDGYFVLHDKTKESKGNMLLPTDSTERKGIPITTGVLDYFPLAIAEVAKASYAGNKQHHPDSPLFWDKTKSTDHADCIARHLIDRGKVDSDGIKHSAKLAWRALALLEIELENERGTK